MAKGYQNVELLIAKHKYVHMLQDTAAMMRLSVLAP